jgi:hypothetical protein
MEAEVIACMMIIDEKYDGNITFQVLGMLDHHEGIL